MNIHKIELCNFKQISAAEINIGRINVLVGGNNAGKSSILQGIHFSIATATVSRQLEKESFTQDSLHYCPAKEFTMLRHGEPYLNQSNFGFLRLWGEGSTGTTTIAPRPAGVFSFVAPYTIRIYRGRNEGNVGCQRSGPSDIGLNVTNPHQLFSIYVPGLAGVSQQEQYRTPSVIRKAIASGDSNQYLRNVLYQISQKKLQSQLIELASNVFNDFKMEVAFNQDTDVNIDVRIAINGKKSVPLELCGTGLLQAIHIFSYVTLYKPKLLLLDEPDSHLHADNQDILAKTLLAISEDTNTQIILSTHSRHLVESLEGKANFVWLQNGKVKQQGEVINKLPILIDLGSLNAYDKLIAGKKKYVILTEDSEKSYLETLFLANGFSNDEIMIHSYKTSSMIDATATIIDFIKEISIETKIIIHRDRDFMTNEECEKFKSAILSKRGIPFITEGSDIESYFCSDKHISATLGIPESDVKIIKKEIIEENASKIVVDFTNKRNEIKQKQYRGNEKDCPDVATLLGKLSDIGIDHVKGKFLLKTLKRKLQQQKLDISKLNKYSFGLASPDIANLK